MSRKTYARFDEASEDFYLHVTDLEVGDRVMLEGHMYLKRHDGSLQLSTDLADYCTNPSCTAWELVPFMALGQPDEGTSDE